jgi:hypothetical protein
MEINSFCKHSSYHWGKVEKVSCVMALIFKTSTTVFIVLSTRTQHAFSHLAACYLLAHTRTQANGSRRFSRFVWVAFQALRTQTGMSKEW